MFEYRVCSKCQSYNIQNRKCSTWSVLNVKAIIFNNAIVPHRIFSIGIALHRIFNLGIVRRRVGILPSDTRDDLTASNRKLMPVQINPFSEWWGLEPKNLQQSIYLVHHSDATILAYQNKAFYKTTAGSGLIFGKLPVHESNVPLLRMRANSEKGRKCHILILFIYSYMDRLLISRVRVCALACLLTCLAEGRVWLANMRLRLIR